MIVGKDGFIETGDGYTPPSPLDKESMSLNEYVFRKNVRMEPITPEEYREWRDQEGGTGSPAGGRDV